ncbi:MAG: hypothetical protein Q7T45_21250 [Bradyrhizobium sp.]|uniref:hypothetical protein n=1 Tax=Bradyrhizobium sp. TaxID=376 RepID=UPI002726A629|nr:hypothetical protein [Bradyrhizobium sp.]MDO8400350.1 hypothetical protein [Bradyrhizobium sp.]
MKWWKKKSDPLVEETLAFVQGVASPRSDRDEKAIQAAELIESVLHPELPKPKDRLFRDEKLEQRLSEFKAVQHRFERERDEFFNRTMSKVRSSLSRNDV